MKPPINHNERVVFQGGMLDLWKERRKPGYAAYRRAWNNNPRNEVVGDFPIHLDFEITSRCNLKCTFCMRTGLLKGGVPKGFFLGDLNPKVYFKAVGEGETKGLRSIKYNFLGEPLLVGHERLYDYIHYATSLDGIMDTMMNTNGCLLNHDMSKAILEAGLDKLIISMDSPVKKTYEGIRVGATFEEVVGNVRHFIELRNSGKFFKTSVRLQLTVIEDNKYQVGDFMKMWKPYADEVTANVACAIIENEDRETFINDPNRLMSCPAPWQRMIVLADGRIVPCCGDHHHTYILGHAMTDSLEDIWKGKKMKALRTAISSGKIDEVPLCQICSGRRMRPI